MINRRNFLATMPLTFYSSKLLFKEDKNILLHYAKLSKICRDFNIIFIREEESGPPYFSNLGPALEVYENSYKEEAILPRIPPNEKYRFFYSIIDDGLSKKNQFKRVACIHAKTQEDILNSYEFQNIYKNVEYTESVSFI